MLKLSSPHEEAEHEAVALQAWRGDGAVRLLRADPRRWALLLERLHADEDLTRVGDLEAVHPQPCGDLRKFLRELGAHLEEMLQLTVVVVEQSRIHYIPPEAPRSESCIRPVSRSISVRMSRSSGTGCAHSWP